MQMLLTFFALNGKKQLASRFRYIDYVLSINNSKIILARISCWTWDQGHHREHHFCFLSRFTTVDLEGCSTPHFHLRQKRWFQFPHHRRSWAVIFHLRRPMAFLSLSLYDTPGLAHRMNVLFWGGGGGGQATFQLATKTGIPCVTLENVIPGVFCCCVGFL